MKKLFLLFPLFSFLVAGAKPKTDILTISTPVIDTASPINATISGNAGTKYFNARHRARAWLTNTPGKGLTLNFETDALATSATIESTDKAPYHIGSGMKQTTDFSGSPVKKYFFYLDSPAYRGHKAYILQLITPDVKPDAGLYWGCVVIRK